MRRRPGSAGSLVLLVACLGLGPAAVATDDAAAQEHARFTYKGVIEGFYGPPWPRQERIDFLRWMADHGQNLYIHAPKNDPYQRLQWRDPYPADEMEQFRAEVEVATRMGVSWVPSLSPAFPLIEAAQEHDEDICFSCPDDVAVLFAKLDAFWDIGVRSLMISYDDVLKISSHPEDTATYGQGDHAYGVMNAELLNAVHDRYAARDAGFRLFTVPADYFGVTTTPYLEGFRSRINPDVVIMWTGVAVVSPTISCTEANAFAGAIGRKPLLWDNYPVNDYAPDKMLVGPYRGRAPDLASCLDGIVSNPANQVRANRIPLFTVADYLNDPEGYQPERSWERSLLEFAGDQREMLGRFIENVRSGPLDRTEAVRFTSLRDELLTALDTQDWPVAYDELTRELEAEAAAPARLRAEFHDQAFVADADTALSRGEDGQYSQAGSWLERLAFNARNGLEAAAHLARTRPHIQARISDGVLLGTVTAPADAEQTQAAIVELRGMRDRDDGNPANVHGDRQYNALGPQYLNENRMDAFFDSARDRIALHLPRAEMAASAVTVTVEGEPVTLAGDGSFSAPATAAVDVVAVDGAGETTRRVVTPPPGRVRRIAGDTRIQTAVRVAREHNPLGAATVVLARADAYPDTLAGGPLARRERAPILLTSSDGLHPEVAAEIRRLGAVRAVLLGGAAALGPAVEEALLAQTTVLEIDRIAGDNRFATAAAIARRLGGERVWIAEGEHRDPARGWPDALAISAFAALEEQPILLVARDSLPDETRAALQVADAARIVGGPAAVSDGLAQSVVAAGVAVRRVGGLTRYDTSRAVADEALASGVTMAQTYLASGSAFPDALAAGATVAAAGGMLLLVPPDRLAAAPTVQDLLSDTAGTIQRVTVLGGTAAVSAAVEADVGASVGPG